MTEPIIGFVQTFEAKFKHVLLNPPREKPSIYTDFFLVNADQLKTPYSDWDIECWLRPEAATKATLLAIDTFVRHHEALKSTGLLLPTADQYLDQTYHHIESAEVQHYMAVLDGLKPPFIDITVHGIESGTLQSAFPGEHNQEFESWILLTAWRKLLISRQSKNPDDEDYQFFINRYVRPFYGPENVQLRKDPEIFFKRHIPAELYGAALDTLQSASMA
jgi:hypothetical protein